MTEAIAAIHWPTFARLTSPIWILIVSGLIILLLSPLKKSVFSFLIWGLLGLSVLVTFYQTALLWLAGSQGSMGLLAFDRLAFSLDLILLVSLSLTLLLSHGYLRREKIEEGEYAALLLFATAGGMILTHAADLILLFLGLEIASLSVYILTGLKREAVRSAEASLKYFVIGSIASGFLLYGIAMGYGATGSTSLAVLQQASLSSTQPILLLFCCAFLLIGLGFKIAAVPFHHWSPDVYEGAPTSVTAYMAAAIKAVGFAALIRLVIVLGHIPQIPWTPILWVLSALTMTVGNVVALRQTNIKRMLAYSSIAHAGYALVGLTAAVQKNALASSTLGAVLFYLFAYAVMTIGAFAVVIALGRHGDDAEEMTDLAGLSEKHPYLAAAMALFLFSLTGMPPTIGFIGKFYLFSGAIEAGLTGLVIVGVLNSVISAYYYLGPIVKMYFQKQRDYVVPPLSYGLLIAVFFCFFIVLYLGVMPSDVFLMARESVRELVF